MIGLDYLTPYLVTWDQVKFTSNEVLHSLTLEEVLYDRVRLSVESEKQTFDLMELS